MEDKAHAVWNVAALEICTMGKCQIWSRCGFPGPLRKARARMCRKLWSVIGRDSGKQSKKISQTRYPSANQRLSTKEAMG